MKPHGVQLAALQAAGGNAGYAYFLEQGLGKTALALMEFANLVAEGEVTRLLVIAPNSFKKGWQEEAAKWGFDFEFHLYDSASSGDWWLDKKFTKPVVLVINYESVRARPEKKGKRTFYHHDTKGLLFATKFITDAPGAMIVADESVQLKGHNTLQTIGAVKLASQCKYKRILTGKPIVQGPHDLWGQFRFIGHFADFPYHNFKNAFCRMGGFANKQVLAAQNEDILEERLKGWVFRATKADWTDLPPKVYTAREYKMTPEMKAMYKGMEDDFVLWLESGDHVTVDAAITKYIKLAQIQAGFIIDEDEKVHVLVDPGKNPRVALLRQIIDEEVVGKVTIPYRHRYVQGLLRDQLADLQPACIGGGMTPDEIEAEKERFNANDNCRVILLQMSAAKYGHTLLGGPEPDNRCSTSIIFENSYSGDDRSQIDDRVHRYGQTADCVTYIDLVGTSLDRAMIRAQQRKENIFQTVFKNIRNYR